MADKKLNEVSQLTDFDYALVVKGNDVAKVTKQQLATIYGVLVVLCSKSFGAAQIYISDGTENIYVRKSYNLGKTWGEWLLIKGVNIT